jgi:hypothetical protein
MKTFLALLSPVPDDPPVTEPDCMFRISGGHDRTIVAIVKLRAYKVESNVQHPVHLTVEICHRESDSNDFE